MPGDLEPLPARLAGRAGRGPGGAGGRAAGPVRAELPVIGGLAEREQVLVSAWLTGGRAATRRAGCVISRLQWCLLCLVTIAAGVVAEADADASLRYVLAQALEANERLARQVSGRSSERARPEAAGGGDGGGDPDRADGGKRGKPRGPGGGPGGGTTRICPGSRWSGTSPAGTAARSAGCRSRRWAIASPGSWTGRCSCGRSRVAAGAGGPASAGCPPR